MAALTGALALTGCGVSVEDAGGPTVVPGVGINGHVHGGVYPIQNATIRLMVTQTSTEYFTDSTGVKRYGGSYGGYANPLLKTTSDANGYFTFPDTGWSCNSDQYAYVTVTGGHTSNLSGTTQNDNVVQVGVIGSCSDFSSQTAIDNINLFVSELSTVAAAYSLGNFITIDNTNAASGQQIVNISAPDNNSVAAPACTGTASAMKCTAAGLPHAFANGYSLVDSVKFDNTFPTGAARTYNPNNTNSAVPQAMINTIGNILQNCVDSLGGGVAGDGSYCGNLFTAATPPSGTAPTNTLQTAMDMAKFPTNNLSGLYSLQSRTAFFTPDLDQAPTSFTVSFFYGATASGSYVPYPVDLALDALDSVYVLYGDSGATSTGTTGTANTYGAVFALYASGASQYYGSKNTSILYPSQIAIAEGGRVYVSNNDTTTPANGGVYATNTASSTGALTQVVTLPYASGLAVDQSNGLWVSAASSTSNSIYEYSKPTINASTGNPTPTYYSGVLNVPVIGLAVDQSQNIWGVSSSGSSGTSSAVVLANTGTVASPTYPTTGTGGITKALGSYNGFGVALNSSAAAFFPQHQQLGSATYASTGITVDPNGTATVSGSGVPHRAQVDGAGHVFWADNEASGLLYMYTPPNTSADGTSNCTSSTSTDTNGCLSTGTTISLLPCFPFPTSGGLQCITTNNSSSAYTPSNLRAVAIDSAGDIWYAADAGYGTVVETLGLASPTWPQVSYGHPGVKPQ